MAIVVIGGHSRSVGKTSVVAELISALPEYDWTAVKITQYGHGVCSADGVPCDCATADHTWAISEEKDRGGESDTSRFLLAGAMRALWVRTEQGRLAEAMPALRRRLDGSLPRATAPLRSLPRRRLAGRGVGRRRALGQGVPESTDRAAPGARSSTVNPRARSAISLSHLPRPTRSMSRSSRAACSAAGMAARPGASSTAITGPMTAGIAISIAW